MKIVLCLLLVLPMVPAPPTDKCATNPCQHGQCENQGEGGYKCTCDSGWKGKDCDKLDCDSSPCLNGGTCDESSTEENVASGENSEKCQCPPGYTGTICETDIDECTDETDNCHTNAACTDSPPGSFTCTCNSGYEGSGVVCTAMVCNPNPCQNGQCQSNADGYTCTCDAGWTGPICNEAIDNCSPNPCENGGSCVSAASEYVCQCLPGYTGTNCQTALPT